MTAGEVIELDRERAHERLDVELSMLWRRLRRISVVLAREMDDGLEAAAYGVLGVLYDADKAVRGGDLAEKFGLDKSTVSRQIAQMEELGLLQRVPDPQDGRARLIRITDEGRARFGRLRDRRERWIDAALRDWPPEDVDHMIELLARLNGSLERPPSSP